MKRIYDHLKENNLNPYFPGQHEGLCKEPYTVVLERATIPSMNSNRLGQVVVYIAIHAPSKSYKAFEEYVNKVRTNVNDLGILRKTGHETPVLMENDKKAYTKNLEYVLQKKLEV